MSNVLYFLLAVAVPLTVWWKANAAEREVFGRQQRWWR